MTREFIITKEFDRTWKELGLNDEDLGELEIISAKILIVEIHWKEPAELGNSAGLWKVEAKAEEQELYIWI